MDKGYQSKLSATQKDLLSVLKQRIINKREELLNNISTQYINNNADNFGLIAGDIIHFDEEKTCFDDTSLTETIDILKTSYYNFGIYYYDKLVGGAHISYDINYEDANIMIIIDRQYRGLGIATYVYRRGIKTAFELCDIKTILITVHFDNLAMKEVIKKLHFNSIPPNDSDLRFVVCDSMIVEQDFFAYTFDGYMRDNNEYQKISNFFNRPVKKIGSK